MNVAPNILFLGFRAFSLVLHALLPGPLFQIHCYVHHPYFNLPATDMYLGKTWWCIEFLLLYHLCFQRERKECCLLRNINLRSLSLSSKSHQSLEMYPHHWCISAKLLYPIQMPLLVQFSLCGLVWDQNPNQYTVDFFLCKILALIPYICNQLVSMCILL